MNLSGQTGWSAVIRAFLADFLLPENKIELTRFARAQ
jgi:hypothetical protein